jgi:hypothetical protein
MRNQYYRNGYAPTYDQGRAVAFLIKALTRSRRSAAADATSSRARCGSGLALGPRADLTERVMDQRSRPQVEIRLEFV